ELEEITDQELIAFRQEACRQANATWQGIGLVTPNDFPGFDWPRANPTVRPNVNCLLKCSFTENPGDAHVTGKVVAPASEGFYSGSSRRKSLWSIRDTGPHRRRVDQDPHWWYFNKEKVLGFMVPHEVGHLLGLDHIGETLQAGSCLHFKEAVCS